MIIRAESSHADVVAALFDQYRQFYDCAPDLELAQQFIQARLHNQESVIFLALDAQQNAQGFVQLYPSFCSVEAVKILILYDLYVQSGARRLGVGEALMHQAREYADESGVSRIDLLTEFSNTAGQTLYEKLGYKKTNQHFHAYSLNL